MISADGGGMISADGGGQFGGGGGQFGGGGGQFGGGGGQFGGGQFDAKGNFGGQGAAFGGVRYEGPAQRMCGACGSLCVGVMLVFVTCYAEYANEQTFVYAEATANLVKTAMPVGCAQNAAVESYTDDLVLVSCPVTQPDLSLSLPSQLRPFVSSFYGTTISWHMDIYQWHESSTQHCRKTDNGGQVCTTTYHYNSAWSSSTINSNAFHAYNAQNPAYHNSGSFPNNIQNDHVGASLTDVALGLDPSGNRWFLTQDLLDQFPAKSVRVVGIAGQPPQVAYPGFGNLGSSMLHEEGGYLQTGYPRAPRIGDVRITLMGHGLPVDGYGTVCAQQNLVSPGPSVVPFFQFRPYPGQPFDWWGRVTNPLAHFEAGQLNPSQFEENWHNANTLVVYAFRFFLWVLMWVAISMVFEPLSVMADALRMLNYVSCGLGSMLDGAAQAAIQCAAFIVATFLFLIVFAAAWIVSNPTFGVSLLAGAVVAYIVGLKLMPKAAKSRELSYVKIVDLP